jgi:uncharacterized alkaline shock family protein YloU
MMRLLTGSRYFWWLLLAAVALLLLGMLGLFVSLARKREPTQVIIGRSEGGQVNISLEAVDDVVRKAALSVNGVREVKTRLKAGKNGVDVSLRIVIPHDTSVPETSTALQNAVKEQLQAIAGLTVAEISVLVSTVEGKMAPTTVA